MAPGDMPERIAALCREGGQAPPAGPGETVRSILVSLACKYRLVLERLARRRPVPRPRSSTSSAAASRNELLCRLTADLTRLEVLAGPDEATALGNALVQARAAGEIGGSLAQLREVAAASCAGPQCYEPARDEAAAGETYARFLDATGLGTGRPQAVAARHPRRRGDR